MATSDLTLEQIYNYFKEKGNVVKNHELVHHFKKYLTDPDSKDDARVKFKSFVNILAHSKTENGVKYLMLKTKYQTSLDSSKSSPQLNPISSPVGGSPNRQPPPYRPPPPPPVLASPTSPSFDNISLCSTLSQDSLPQAPPRRKQKSLDEDCVTPNKMEDGEDNKVSVKERTQKFNRLASIEDELSPSPKKSNEKKIENKGVDEDDGASVTSLEPKKCVEWCVTASKGDLQELVKLAKDEPRLVNRKNVLHWGAKHGNGEIIKVFAGRYKVDVNGRTNGKQKTVKNFQDNENKNAKRKSKRQFEGLISTPSTPQQPTRNCDSKFFLCNDSDSDSAAGFDSHWKN